MLYLLNQISESFLIYPLIIIFLVGIVLSLKLRFVQLRAIPAMFKMLLFNQDVEQETEQSISPRSALFTVISTAIGVGSIAGPIAMIGFGGPQAIAGFLLASLIGAAITFYEVFLAIKYRQTDASGNLMNIGAMAYLQQFFGSGLARFYAAAVLILLSSWTFIQMHNVTKILHTSGANKHLAGICISVISMWILIGGIKRISKINDFLVPIMFLLYCAVTLSIIIKNCHRIPAAFGMIFGNFFCKEQVLGLTSGFGLVQSFRWGISRAINTNEFGIGTATFGHANVVKVNPNKQAILAIVAINTNIFLSLLTSLTVLVTDSWLHTTQFDISLFYQIVQNYYPTYGPLVLTLCVVMFAFGTILGNSYNSSLCFGFLAGRNYQNLFYIGFCSLIFVGAIMDNKLAWVLADICAIPVAIPHVLAILTIACKHNIFKKNLD